MNKALKVAAIVLLLLLPTGCWNSREIQYLAYITVLGVDYVDDHFTVYGQVLNFSNVAKSESGQVGSNTPIWIGRGEGKSITEAINSLNRTSQLRVFWSHLKTVICHERLVQNPQLIQQVTDGLNRYREIRYNVLLYGTKDELPDILRQNSLLHLSPLDSLLNTPTQIYAQRSYILPVYGYKIIAQSNEVAQTAILPTIALDKGTWTAGTKKVEMFNIDGAFLFNEHKLAGWLSEPDLAGYRWMQKKLDRALIHIPNEEKPKATLVMIKTKPHIKAAYNEGNVHFHIDLSIQAYLDEMVVDLDEHELEKQAEQVLREQIRTTYLKGVAIGADIFQLGLNLYRSNPKEWREWMSNGGLDKNSLDQIDVHVHLLHTGKYKNRVQ
ncbi:MAG: hypothetical protein K0Q59_176 [Paenibacillus sp.]|nr:hypothetical protein [Paenibacillus sp.]